MTNQEKLDNVLEVLESETNGPNRIDLLLQAILYSNLVIKDRLR